MRTLRHSLSLSEKYIATQLITNKIINLNKIHQSKHIAIFISFDGEICTNLLIKTLLSMNKKIYLPIILPSLKNQLLSFAQYNLSTPLILNHLNIYEPIHKKTSLISLDILDILFVPLVAFDNNKNRLGMGKGFYDKTLQYWKNKSNYTTIGLGYDFQNIPSYFLPSSTSDIKLSKIITPLTFF